MALWGQEWTSGTTASAIGHAALVAWLLSGFGLTHDPLPFEVTTVSVVSGEEYEQLVAATTPEALEDLGTAPEAPVAEDTPPAPAPLTQDTPPPAPEPPPEAPAEEAPPPPAPEPVPQPAEVTEQVTEIVPPAPEVPPSAPDLETALRPVPRPADRVAPDPVAPPPPDAEVAPEVQQEVTPDAEAPDVVQPEAEATAPEEAAAEIVTEAETPSGAVESALRPPVRPARVAAAEEPVQETPEAPADTSAADAAAAEAAVADALAAALAAEAGAADAGSPAAAEGPPMTGSERDAFRLAVSGCWNIDVGSEASRVTLTVGFALGRDGKVVGNEVRLVGADGGSAAAIDVAFQAARRAVLRCQSTTGYQLPDDKYDQWREVEMTFDPSGMRMR